MAFTAKHAQGLKVGDQVFVHRYKYSHDNVRRKYKRRLKDGKVRLVRQSKDGWVYEWITAP